MGKVVKGLIIATAIAAAFIPGVGPAISGAIVGIGGGTFAAASVASYIVGGVILAGGALALGAISKMLAPKNRLDSGQELRSAIRSATPPRLLCYGEVQLPGVRDYRQGYGL